MDRRHISDDDVFLWACGELEPERREQVEAAIEADPALAEKARQFTETLKSLGQGEKAMTSNDFNTTLRAKLEADLSKESARAPKLSHRTTRRLVWAAAAAAVLLALGLFGIFGGRQSNIVWADVVEAVGAVRNLHVTILHSDDGEEERIELYYRHPNTWRIHSKETLQFATGDQMKVYDARTRQFVDDLSTVRGRIVPLPELQFLGNDNLLDTMLQTFFRYQVPEGEPVMTTPDALAPDIALFDYANDPEQLWIRVWVLRESRLPIRVEMYNPKADNYALVLFNYSDPQPDSFFDADVFAREVKEKHLDKPYQMYRVGTRPLAGTKPLDRRQVQDIERQNETAIGQVEVLNEQYGVKAPTLLKIEADKSGDLLLVIRDPANAKAKAGYEFKEQGYWPNGYHITGNLDRFLWDTWGNAYVRTEAFALKHGGGCRIHMTYVPIPPLKSGVGKHTLAVTYSLRDRQTRGSQLISRTLVDMPQPPSRHDPYDQWGGDDSKARTLEPFVRTATTLIKEADRLDTALAEDPTSQGLIIQKINLLRKLDQEGAAWKLFEERLKDRSMTGAFMDDRLSDVLGSYLFYLQEQGRTSEIETIVAELKNAEKEAFNTMKPNRVEHVEREIENAKFGHYLAMHIPENVRRLKAGPQPRVARIIRSRDDCVYIEFDQLGDVIPHQGQREWGHAQSDQGFGSMNKSKDGKLIIVTKVKGDQLTFIFHPTLFISQKEGWSYRNIPWPITVEVPEATVATGQDILREHWPSAHSPSDPLRFTTPFRDVVRDADVLYEKGRYEMAMARYQEAAKMQLSDMFGKGTMTLRRGLITDTEYSNRRWARHAVAKCLIKLGRLDDAQSLLDELEEERLSLNLRASEEGLERMQHWNWHASDEVYWMLRDARKASQRE